MSGERYKRVRQADTADRDSCLLLPAHDRKLDCYTSFNFYSVVIYPASPPDDSVVTSKVCHPPQRVSTLLIRISQLTPLLATSGDSQETRQAPVPPHLQLA